MKLGKSAFRIVVVSLAMVARLAATDVLSHHNDLASTGQNLTETQITPANLTVATFQKRFATSVDSLVQAQPLYKAGVGIASGPNQGAHDMAFVATFNGTLYGIDVNNGTKLWQTSLPAQGPPNQTWEGPLVGLQTTPVINPATNEMFVVYNNNQQYEGESPLDHHCVFTLYTVDIRDGAILRSTIIADTTISGIANTFSFRTNNDPAAAQDPFVFGTGDGAIIVNGTSRVYMNAARQLIRCGLTLLNGEVYVTMASVSDEPPFHGWIVRYNAATLATTGVFNVTPNAAGGGIWQSGGVLSVDSDGFIYCITGNGSFDGDMGPGGETIGLNPQGFPVNANYGDCYLKLGQDATSTPTNQNPNGWGLKVVDYFAPYNNQALSAVDADLGSGGPVILPDSVGNVAHPHLLVGCGKEGKIYLVDRDDMGKFDAQTDHMVQSLGHVLYGCHSTPAYYNGRLYYVDAYYGGRAKTFDIADAAISSVSSVSSDYFTYPGGTPMISANGTANAIVWNIDRNTRQLRAYDAAAGYGTEVWNSAMAGGRDALGAPLATFAIPVVADGRVLVATTKALVVYGPPAVATTAPAAPTGLVATTTSGAEITLTWNDNANNEDTYRIERSTDGVAFTEVAMVGVNVSSHVAGGLASGTAYSFRVRAANAAGTSAYSNVATGFSSSQAPAINLASGFQNSAGLVQFNGSAAVVNSRARMTDGQYFEQGGSVWTVAPQNVADFSTQFTFQVGPPALGEGLTFCIQNAGLNSVGSGSGTLGYQGIGSSVAVKFDFTSSASTTGLYLNGAQPSGGPTEVDLSAAGINFRSGNIFKVQLTYDGTTLTETITDTFTNATATASFAVDIPATVGGTSARVGFTGGTFQIVVPGQGFGHAIQEILSWSYFHVPTTPPSAPGSLAATPASGTQVNLSWLDNSNNEDGFIIQRKTGVAGTYQQVGEVGADATSYMNGGLTPATTYYYRILATNVLGQSGYSDEVQITTPTAPLPAGNLHATEVTASAVGISWDPATYADGYGVLRAASTEANYARLASSSPDATLSLPPNATSYRDTTVLPGVTYSYLVQAFNIAGISVSELIVTTPTKVSIAASGGPVRETLPGTATFTVSRLGQTTDALIVSYQIATGTGQAAYGARYTLSPAPSSITIPAGQLSATITLAAASDIAVLGPKTATLTVLAAAGYEPAPSASSASVQILDSPLDPPSTLAATAVSGTQVFLSWSDNSNNESSFIIQRKTGPGGTYADAGSAPADATTFTDSSAEPNTSYCYRVRAANANGPSTASNEVSITTPFPPPAPNNLLASALSSSLVSIGWTNVATNASSILLFRKAGAASTFTQIASLATSAVSYNDTDVLPGVTYQYLVRPSNIAGSSDANLTVATSTLISITASGGPVQETLPGTASFTVSRLGETTNPLTVSYQIATGTDQAAYGTRYTLSPVPSSITIPAGQLSATITLAAAADLAVLGPQSATLTVLAAAGYEPAPSASSASVQILDSPLDPPSTLAATALSGTQVFLSWSDNSNNESSFIIQRKTGADGAYADAGSAPADATTFTDSSAEQNTSYCYRVRAANANGPSAPSNEVSITTPFPPPAPNNLLVSALSPSLVSIGWTNVATNASSILLLRKAGAASAFTQIASLAPSAVSYNDSDVLPGVTYQYLVRPSNIAGSSDASLTVVTPTLVSIAASGGPVQETLPGTATFTVSRLGETTNPLTVSYQIATGAGQAAYGTRYTFLPAPSSVTIPVGALSAMITLTPGTDLAVLGTQCATVSLVTGAGYELDSSATAKVRILDTPINRWKIEMFGSVAAAQAPAADDNASPAGDRIPNLLKYALGMDPNTRGVLPGAVLESDLAGHVYLTLTVQRPLPVPTDINYFFEICRNLTSGTWTPATIVDGYPADNGNGTETIKICDAEPVSANPRGFLRLRVSRP